MTLNLHFEIMKVSPSSNSMSKTTDRLSTQNRLSSSETSLGRVIPQAIDLEEAVLGAMMLEHLGHKSASDDIVRAIEEVLENKNYRTGDLGGKANTKVCGTAVLDAL